MNAVLYIRVSTLDQAREGYSLDAQRRSLSEWCTAHGYHILQIYEDAGISGKDIKHRPAMRTMLADVQERNISLVLVWSLSRLTRSVADLYDTWALLDRHSCGLVSYTEAFDTSTPTGRAMMGMLGVFAQMEREITAERVAASMRERAAQGGRTCSCVLGYDTVPGGLIVNSSEAAAVKGIYREFERTGSLSETARWCQKHGITGKRGRKMDAYKVRVILTRPIYAGYYSYNDLRVRGDIEPIITVRQYNRVARKINELTTGRRPNKEVPLL